jgi:UDP-2-acetamido-2-deoxy-ribo-hexuluronate aminotransferase
MEFINLNLQYKKIENKINDRIQKVLNHGRFIMGPEVQELEEELCAYIGSKHCVGVSNGTDALQIALMALGIGKGDEVIIPDFTFFATAEVVALLGATPVFCDVDKSTYNISVNSIKEKITNKTKAIMPVSMFGQCADFVEINKLVKDLNIPVIEDGAQSFGATHHGKKSLNLATMGCTSFFPSKPLGCYGDGGACFTDDDDLAETFRQLRSHGQSKRYCHTRIGMNARLDTIQAAILLEKLKLVDMEIKLRQEVAERYKHLLGEYFVVPTIEEFNTSVFAQYTILVNNRLHAIEKLKQENIPAAIHYPIPLSKQPVFDKLPGSMCKNSEEVSKKVMSLPFYPYLTEADQQKIADVLIKNKLFQ